MSLSSVQKVARSGTSLIIVVPKKISEILKINLGDYIKIDWGEVIPVTNKKAIKKLKESEEELPELDGN